MTPNVNVYGAADTWLHVLPLSGYNADNKNFVPAWQTIGAGIAASKINFPDAIDNSICYAAIAEDSPIAEINTVQASAPTVKNTTLPVRSPIFAAFLNTESYGKFTQTYYDISNNTNVQIYTPNETLADANLNKYVQPMCSISPKDTVLKIVVRAYKDDWSSWNTFKYNEYLNGNESHPLPYYTEYPHIFHIYCLVYARTENSENRTRQYIDADNVGGFYIERDIEFNCPVWDTVKDYTLSCLKGGAFNGVHVWGICDVNGKPYYGDTPNYIYKCIGVDGTLKTINDAIIMYRDYNASDDFVRRCVASLGLFFCDDDNTAENGAYNSNTMYLGTIDENGLLHGDYTHGTDNETQSQYNWISTNDSTYDPTKDYDNTKYDNATHFNTQASVGSCNKRYIITEEVLNKCVGELATALTTYTTDTTQESSLKAFLTNNPMDCIISLKKFPVNNIPGYALTPTALKFGAYTSSDATIVGRELTKAWSQYDFTFSNNNRNGIYPVYGNTFLDYEPYTRAELIIPFCGTVQIPLADFMGHDIRVRLIIDFVTGACTAFIMRDLIALMSISGQAGVDIGVSGVQTATLDSQITNANMQYKAAQLNSKETTVSAFAQTISSGLKADVGSVIERGVSNYYNMEHAALYEQQAQYNAEHVQVPFKQLSASTGVISLAYEQACRLVIYRPKLSPDYDADVYAKTVGFACLKNGKVSDFSGLTVGAINLNGVPCTAEEKTMIINDFARGVIL